MMNPQAREDKLLIDLIILHVLERPNWNTLQEEYFNSRQFDKVLVCYKLRHTLGISDDDDLKWIEKALSANEPFGYLMKSLTTTCDYIQLAEAYAAESDQFEITLNYYMLQLSKSPTVSAALSIIE